MSRDAVTHAAVGAVAAACLVVVGGIHFTMTRLVRAFDDPDPDLEDS